MFKSNRNQGFTLVEVMIALAVSGILLVGLTKLYTLMLKSYSLQEELTEMNQNAKFTIKEISDILTQAGADCAAMNSDTTDKDTIIKVTGDPPYSDFTLRINPRGGLFIITMKQPIGAQCSVQVSNVANFRVAKKLGQLPYAVTVPTRTTVRIYNLDSIHTTNSNIFISGGAATDTFFVNDAIYSFDTCRYYLNGTNLCLNADTNVLAENIDSFKVTFFDVAGNSSITSTPPWLTMRSASMVVVATTATPDCKYPGDGKRRLKLSYKFRLKNKV